MEEFDISKVNPMMQKKIRSCKNPAELKQLFAANNLEVPDSKLESILKLSGKSYELDAEDLELVSGGDCEPTDSEPPVDNWNPDRNS